MALQQIVGHFELSTRNALRRLRQADERTGNGTREKNSDNPAQDQGQHRHEHQHVFQLAEGLELFIERLDQRNVKVHGVVNGVQVVFDVGVQNVVTLDFGLRTHQAFLHCRYQEVLEGRCAGAQQMGLVSFLVPYDVVLLSVFLDMKSKGVRNFKAEHQSAMDAVLG